MKILRLSTCSVDGFRGLEQSFEGFEQGSANYLGLNRILRDSWPHAPPLFRGTLNKCRQEVVNTENRFLGLLCTDSNH